MPWPFARGEAADQSSTKSATTVREYMTPASKLVLLTPDMSLNDAACKLCASGISGAPVIGESIVTGEPRLVGIISQKDLLHNAAGRGYMRFLTSGPRSERHIVNTQRLRKIMQGDVGSIMSARPMTIPPDATVKEAARLMLERNINRLPVVSKEGGLVGVLSTSDIMKTVTGSAIGCEIFD
jgi:CBS domain-containing protein